jgi:DNA-binding response OmpR family regulator
MIALSDKNRPDLLLVERTMLARIDLPTLNSLTESSRWAPLLILDPLTAGAQNGVDFVLRLAQSSASVYHVGDLHIDTRKRRARLGDRWVTLPPIQYRLLVTLARRAGEVVAVQELLHAAWGYEATETESRELVKAHIRQIRRRLGLDPEKHHYIRSVRGFGYMLAPLDEE